MGSVTVFNDAKGHETSERLISGSCQGAQKSCDWAKRGELEGAKRQKRELTLAASRHSGMISTVPRDFFRSDQSERPLNMVEPDLHLDSRAGHSHCELHVTIRQMVDEDANEVHEIHCACLTRTLASRYTQEQIAAWMKGRTPAGYINAARGGERFCVAETGGRVVGFASWQGNELLSLFVHPDAQGIGVGSRLLDACLSDAAAQGAVIICLKAAVGADQFYVHRGFVPVGQGGTVKNGVIIQDTRMVLPNLAPT